MFASNQGGIVVLLALFGGLIALAFAGVATVIAGLLCVTYNLVRKQLGPLGMALQAAVVLSLLSAALGSVIIGVLFLGLSTTLVSWLGALICLLTAAAVVFSGYQAARAESS